MKQISRISTIIALVIAACLVSTSLCSCSSNSERTQETITSFDQLKGKTCGYLTGTITINYAEELVGDPSKAYGFNMGSDLPVALEGNKIESFIHDELATLVMLKEYPNQRVLDGYIFEYSCAYVFNKTDGTSQKAKTQFNEFLAELRSDGSLQEITNMWVYDEDAYKNVDISSLTGENGTLKFATCSATGKPEVFMKNNQITGLDIDLAYRFCKKYGYKMEIIDTDFSGILAGITSGKYDFGSAFVAVTEERKQSVDFSDPYYVGGSVVVVKDTSAVSNVSFIDSVSTSFYRTFIAEDRWQLFVKGIGSTLLITLLALCVGTVVGYFAYMLCRRLGRVCNKVMDFCVWLIGGMPAVVLLMVMFYIVFAAVDIDSTLVAAIAFALVFASSTLGMLRVGVGAVDPGQDVAAKAMGYTPGHGFRRIVLPQAILHILPTYKSEAISLLKGTAVVGYIAVQDLTKMGDIVRSATYEAIFPLIAVAVMYFVLEALLKLVISLIGKKLDGKRRSEAKVLKGCMDAGATSGATEEASQPDTSIVLSHVGKNFGEVAPLIDINATIKSGDVISVIGQSGCGKSTLLRCLNLLDPPTSGSITLDGDEITAKGYDTTKVNKKMGMVFQRWNLFAHWTVVENVMLPQVDLLGRSRSEAYARAIELLTTVGLENKALSYPDELSGGQQQRVAIARTLAMDPEVILFDEPTSALDPSMVGEVQAAIQKLAKAGRTMLIVTHDMDFARSVCNRVFFLDGGIVYEDGAPEQVFDNPQGENTRRFINLMKTITFQQTAGSFNIDDVSDQIDDFFMRNRFSAREEMLARLAVEELCAVLIDPYLPQGTILEGELTFSLKKRSGTFTVRYQGPEFDPRIDGDVLSLNMLRMAGTLEHRLIDSDGFTNEIILTTASN